jgi:hypothetical protein
MRPVQGTRTMETFGGRLIPVRPATPAAAAAQFEQQKATIFGENSFIALSPSTIKSLTAS